MVGSVPFDVVLALIGHALVGGALLEERVHADVDVANHDGQVSGEADAAVARGGGGGGGEMGEWGPSHFLEPVHAVGVGEEDDEGGGEGGGAAPGAVGDVLDVDEDSDAEQRAEADEEEEPVEEGRRLRRLHAAAPHVEQVVAEAGYGRHEPAGTHRRQEQRQEHHNELRRPRRARRRRPEHPRRRRDCQHRHAQHHILTT